MLTILQGVQIPQKESFDGPTQERLALILNSEDTPLAVLDTQGIITEVNQAWLRFSLEGTQDGSGNIGSNYLNVYSRLGIEEAGRIVEGIGKVLSGNSKEFKVDFQYYTASQHYWYEASVFPLIENNVVIAVVVKHLDITERKLIRLRIQKAVDEKQKILDNSLDVICTFDEEGRFMQVSRACLDLWGYEPEELVGKNYIDYVVLADQPKTKEVAERIAQGDNLKYFESNCIRKDGSVIPITWSANWDYYQKTMFCVARDATERKLAEEQIRFATERYQIVTKVTSDAVWDWDLAKGKAYRSKGFVNILGIDISELDSEISFWESLLHPDELLVVTENFRKLIESTENIWDQEYRIRRKSGEYAYVRDRGIVLRDEQGTAVRLIGALQDVSETRYYLALEKLEREVLQRFAERESDLTKVLDYYMEEIELLHPGMICSIMELKSHQLFVLTSPHLSKDYLEAIDGVVIGNNVGSCGTASYLKEKVVVEDIQNDVRWASYKEVAIEAGLRACWSQPIIDSQGKVMATFACYYTEPRSPSGQEENTIERTQQIIQIILEKSRQERDLVESNTRYELVTKATSEAIWDWDLVSNNVYRSETFGALFGHDHTDHSLDNIWTFHIYPEDRERVIAGYKQVLSNATDTVWQDNYRFFRADKSLAYIQDRGLILRDKAGQAVRMVGAMVDITQEKERVQERDQLIEELKKNNEDLRQFSFITSHNFRSPLSNLIGWLNLIKELPVEDTMLAEAIDGFSHSTHALNETVNDLIKILVIKENTSKAQEEVKFRDVLEKCCLQLQTTIEEVGAELIIDDSSAPVLYFAKSYLENILLNLLSNSLKFHSTSRKLRIEITTHTTERYVQLIIKDNGIGFDAERYRDRLFGLYQRFHSHPNSKGLGLYLVKSQIEALGGAIFVESQVNEGTTFTLQFQKVINKMK